MALSTQNPTWWEQVGFCFGAAEKDEAPGARLD